MGCTDAGEETDDRETALGVDIALMNRFSFYECRRREHCTGLHKMAMGLPEIM
jgi:hypothetical protein